MKIEPVRDLLIVRPLTDAEKMTENNLGIIIPDSAKKDNTSVVAIELVGPEVKNKDLQPGVQVLLTAMMMKQEVEWDGKKGQLIKENDIVAVFKE